MRNRYLRPSWDLPEIYLHRTPVDFRKVLYYKALAEERFKWPGPCDDLMSLTGEQINWLLDGYDITLLKGHKTLDYESVG